jgi:nucleoside-diphosphate-sugar epimerase
VNIGISGANGFVGSALVDHLCGQHELTLFVRRARAGAATGARPILCDLATQLPSQQALSSLDVFVHCAHGPALGPTLARDLLERYQHANPSGLFIFVSSINTQVPALSWDVYTRFKMMSEGLLKGLSVHIPAVILRPAFVVSPEHPGSLAPFLLVARAIRVLPVPSRGPRHLFVALADVAEQVVPLAAGYRGQVGVHEVDLIGNALYPLGLIVQKAARESGFRGRCIPLPQALCSPISAALPPATVALCKVKKLCMDLDVVPQHSEHTRVCRAARSVLELEFRWRF